MNSHRKILIFAHVPPPHHGQSYMVKLLLDGLEAHPEAPPYIHVDCRISDGVADIGKRPIVKILRSLKFAVQALWCRFRHRADVLYFIPAPPRNFPIARDWMMLALLRPFFRKTIFHWHAAGLADHVENSFSGWRKYLSHLVYGRADLSIVLSQSGRRDGEYFAARHIEVVPNGIPDPCPDFETRVRPLIARRGRSLPLRLLYISICSREKGLFDCLEAVLQLNREQPHRPISLTVAGDFVSTSEKEEFLRIQSLPEWTWCSPSGQSISLLEYVGFADKAKKDTLFTGADVFCFPTAYPMESFGLVLVEAMAYDLPIVASRWRAIPEILSPEYPLMFQIGDTKELAQKLERALFGDKFFPHREMFLKRFKSEVYLEKTTRLLGKTLV